MKFTYTSLKILIAISRDQKQNTNLFLLSPVALSICTFRIGGKGVPETCYSEGGGKDDSQAFSPCNKASYSGEDREF